MAAHCVCSAADGGVTHAERLGAKELHPLQHLRCAGTSSLREEEASGILLTIVRRWLRTAVAVLQTEELPAVEGYPSNRSIAAIVSVQAS